MNAERWQQIDELLDAVLEIPSERRAAFLSEKCNGDDELRKEVLTLLAAQKESDAFLENSAMNVMAKEIAHDQTIVVDFSVLGKKLGNYRIERPLGAGGMGEVFLAYDNKLNRRVALKILPAEFVLDGERVKRFEREAKAVSALNHPNIVTIYDFGQTDGINFIVTEYIEGVTVRELIKEKPSLKDTLSIVSQTCEALVAAHGSGIMHRDIKPENIMVRPDGYVKVLDFGLAKLAEADSKTAPMHTVKGTVMGTLAYMSPEQAAGDAVTQCTDVWSLGVVLYEMLAGKTPFKAENRQATLHAIFSDEPQPISEFDRSLPAELDRILEKALEKDREMRYQTASDFRADLKRLKREIDSSPSRSSGGGRNSARKIAAAKYDYSASGKDYRLIGAAAALMIVLVAGASWFFFFKDSSRAEAIDWSRAKNVPLTDNAGTEFYPSLAPDGNSFVFAAKAGDSYDIFSQRVGGKNAVNLTETPRALDKEPAYSPDGKFIAYRSERGSEDVGIFIMEATGENPRRISDFGHNPSWSPDSREIVVSDWGDALSTVRNLSKLTVINVETGEKRVLIEGFALQPNWSPHGRRVAYWTMQSGGRRDVATVSIDGGEPEIITGEAIGANWNPVWSPDGRFLYFVSNRGGNAAFWRIAIDEETGKVSGKPEVIPTPANYNRHLSFSRDGKRLIYVQTNEQSNIEAIEFDQGTEKTVGNPFWVTKRDQEVERPELSPNGEQFVMRLSRLTQNDIATVSRDGKVWRDLTNDEHFDKNVRWSPDGKQIAFSSDRSGNYEIWTMNADGTNARQRTFDKTSATNPVWSPDGAQLCYSSNHNSYVLDLNENSAEPQQKQIFPGLENYEFSIVWDWSPDGKKLVGFYKEKNSPDAFGFYSLETKKWESFDLKNQTLLWLPDSRRLVYSDMNKIFIIDADTKKSREIFALPQNQIRSVGISRDGKLLYYTVFTTESDIWLLDLLQNP